MLMGPQDKEKYDAYFPRNLHADKIAEAVDKFYSQPENLPIPIVGAFLVVSLRAGGTSDKFVDEIISDMRETAAKSAK
jgi:hypothetical protein